LTTAPFPNSTFVGLLGETVNFDLGFGTITTYTFNDTLNNPKITSINIVGSSYSAPINQNLFILPSQSFSNLIKNPSGSKVVENQLIIRAAVSKTLLIIVSTLPTLFIHLQMKFSQADDLLTQLGSKHARPDRINGTASQNMVSRGSAGHNGS
jgi:hypothetical protein